MPWCKATKVYMGPELRYSCYSGCGLVWCGVWALWDDAYEYNAEQERPRRARCIVMVITECE